MPWPIGRLLLAEHDVSRGRGWDQTLQKIAEEDEDEAALIEALRQHMLCGEKLTKFFELEAAQRRLLTEHLLSSEIMDSAASRRFPLLLSEEEIAVEPLAMRLIAVEQEEEGISAVFSSIRVNTIRETVDSDELSADARRDLAEYEEIIGLKNVRTQAIDVVYVPRRQRHVDLRVDFPQGGVSEQAENASAMLTRNVNSIVNEEMLGHPVNLFPVIGHMYNSPNEGKVVELAFGTTTRSLKHEKMRRGAVDLRREVYHLGGKAALQTPIDPHRISIEYRRGIGEDLMSVPEVTLASTFRMAAGVDPVLSSAVIRKCASGEDFQYVRRRLRHFLQQNAPDPA